MPISQRTIMLAFLSFTLGLAPFFPEPHIVGKIRWVAGGAVGMQPIDWFDLVQHGLPWLLLVGSLVLDLTGLGQSSRSTSNSPE